MAPVVVQERDRLGELGPVRVRAVLAVDHRLGGLAGTAQLDQDQVLVVAADQAVELVGIPVVGRADVPERVGLDALGQRVAERQVVARSRCRVLDRCPGHPAASQHGRAQRGAEPGGGSPQVTQ